MDHRKEFQTQITNELKVIREAIKNLQGSLVEDTKLLYVSPKTIHDLMMQTHHGAAMKWVLDKLNDGHSLKEVHQLLSSKTALEAAYSFLGEALNPLNVSLEVRARSYMISRLAAVMD